MRVFDDILDTLSDGKYHRLDEIAAGCPNLNANQLEASLGALHRAGFIIRRHSPWSLKTHGAKLSNETANFLKRIKELENEEVNKEVTPQ